MKYKNLVKYKIVSEPTVTLSKPVTNSDDLAHFLRENIFDKQTIAVHESFWIVTFNQANRPVGYAEISRGGITGTVVDVMLIAKYCIDTLAKSIVIAHNHPSGTLNPSNADNLITDKIKEAMKLLDVRLLDHMIITNEKHYSYSDECRL